MKICMAKDHGHTNTNPRSTCKVAFRRPVATRSCMVCKVALVINDADHVRAEDHIWSAEDALMKAVFA